MNHERLTFVLTDRPVVYKDDHGEMVTDLAYQTDFTDMVSGQHAKLQEQFAKGSLDFDVTMAEDFKPAGTDGLQDSKKRLFNKHIILQFYVHCTCIDVLKIARNFKVMLERVITLFYTNFI